MTEKNPYWLADVDGNKALVTGADVRDQLLPLGWAETTEPAGDDMVWTRHDETGGRARFASSVLEVWSAKGWHPDGPPAVDGFASTAVSPPDSTPDTGEQPVPDDKPPTTSKAAPAGAKEKEKTSA